MKWLEKSSKKTVGFTLVNGDMLEVALYQLQNGSAPQLIAKEEFVIKTTPVAERKRLVSAFLSRAGHRIQFKHLLMRERAFMKQFQFPSRNLAEIKQMLILRLPREIPSALDQIVYHFHPIGGRSQADYQTNVLLFGVSKELIDQERELLKSFGIVPQQILLSSIILSFFIKKKLGPSPGLPRLVLYGANGKGEVILVNDQGVEFSRSFSYDAADLVHSMQDAIQPIFESLEHKEEIKTFDLCVAGDVEKIKDQIFHGSYPNRLSLHPSGENISAVDFLLFAGADVCEENFDQFNLLPEEVKQGIAVAKSETHAAHLRVSFILILLILVFISLFSSVRMLLALSSVNQKLSELEPSVRQTKEVSQALQMIHIVKLKKIRPLDLLVQAHAEAPDGVLLNEFEYDDKEEFVRLKGRSDSQALIDQYVRKLSGVQWFSKVELQYSESTNEGGKSQFQFAIQAVLKKDKKNETGI